jgi:archaellum biogenesis ATPase FlaH
MMTTENYFAQVERMDVNTLPETLKKGHDLVMKSTSNGTDWSNYHSSESIRRVIDLYFQKLEEYIRTNRSSQPSEELPKTELGPATTIKKSPTKKIRKKKKETSIARNIKQVEHIQEEVKFIKRYVGLHNKQKSPHAILNFIKALQRSIVQKLIRKTSPLANEIEMIQNKLVQAYNKMKGEELFVINDKDLAHLVSIAGGEAVYPSINAIKRYIGLQGQSDEKKIHSFMKYLENLVEKNKITKDDPYADKVNTIYKSTKQRTSSKISISKAELQGLEGIVKACGCREENRKGIHTKKRESRHNKRFYVAARSVARSRDKGLSGVLSAEEMARRKLDLLNFFSFWQALFGSPAKNFTMMFHGEPHNGKTIFLLKLAQYLAENFGEVLYVSSEEFASPTMTKKVNEFLNPLPKRLHFAENLKDPNLADYQFIILDSVNDLGLKINDYRELRAKYPDKAFIFILQHTKAGDFKGGKDWEHIAEIAGEVYKGVVNVTKNRYAPKSRLNFFKQFGIEWQEPANKETLEI